MTNVMVKTCHNQKIIKNSNLIPAMKNSVYPKAKVIRRPNFYESRICPNIYRMFRSVDWTHDMTIVKWHLFIWHERKHCALTNAPPVQSTQKGLWLSTLFHANCSAGQVYVLYPRQIIFALSCRRRSFLHVLESTERYKRYFETFFLYLMMTNVMVKTCLNHKIVKNSNLIQAMKNSVCPKVKVIRKLNFSDSRICPNICPNVYRLFRSVDWRCGLKTRHDNRELRWSGTYSIFPKAEIVRIFTECSVAWIEHMTW